MKGAPLTRNPEPEGKALDELIALLWNGYEWAGALKDVTTRYKVCPLMITKAYRLVRGVYSI